MSYLTQSRLAADNAIIQRVTACAAGEGEHDPYAWTVTRMWAFSAQPGWVGAYASAELAHRGDDTVPLPGENEAAITDHMVLAAVQAVRAAE